MALYFSLFGAAYFALLIFAGEAMFVLLAFAILKIAFMEKLI
jgi:hypothetical protein